MFVKQISVFMENKVGRLARITSLLNAEGIDIRAFSISDTAEFGILRLIVKQPEKAVAVLRSGGLTAQLSDVLVIAVPDYIGVFDDIVGGLAKAEVDIRYMYSFMGEKELGGRVVICADDLNKTFEVLNKKKIKVLEPTEI